MKAGEKLEIVNATEEFTPENLGDRWNNFLFILSEARDYWENEVRGASRKEVELEGGRMAKILHLYRLQKFEVLVPRLIEHYRGFGGLEAMRVVKPIEKEKEGEDNA